MYGILRSLRKFSVPFEVNPQYQNYFHTNSHHSDRQTDQSSVALFAAHETLL